MNRGIVTTARHGDRQSHAGIASSWPAVSDPLESTDLRARTFVSTEDGGEEEAMPEQSSPLQERDLVQRVVEPPTITQQRACKPL